jgi:hypothetical protein
LLGEHPKYYKKIDGKNTLNFISNVPNRQGYDRAGQKQKQKQKQKKKQKGRKPRSRRRSRSRSRSRRGASPEAEGHTANS